MGPQTIRLFRDFAVLMVTFDCFFIGGFVLADGVGAPRPDDPALVVAGRGDGVL